MTYSSSSNTHVFPFGSGRHVYPYDHVLNEVNISNIIKTVTDEKSYLIDYDSDSHQARFVIEGYYFETVVPNQGTVEEPDYNNIYAIANIVDIDGYRYLSGLDSDRPNTKIDADEGNSAEFTVTASGYIDVTFDLDPEEPYPITIKNTSESEALRLSCNSAVQFPQSAGVFVDTMCVHVPKKSQVTLHLYTSTRIDVVVGDPSRSLFTGLYFDTYSEAPTSGYFLQLTDNQGSPCEASLLKFKDTSVEVRGQSLLREIGESDNTDYKSLSIRKSIDTLAEKISEEATARTTNDTNINDKIGKQQDAPEKTTVYGYVNRQHATINQRVTTEIDDINKELSNVNTRIGDETDIRSTSIGSEKELTKEGLLAPAGNIYKTLNNFATAILKIDPSAESEENETLASIVGELKSFVSTFDSSDETTVCGKLNKEIETRTEFDEAIMTLLTWKPL